MAPGAAPPSRRAHDGALGTALVALQLALLVALAWTGVPGLVERVAAGRLPAGAVVAAVAGVVLGLWALWANRPGNFNIRPTPREGGRLVEHGPYRWIRHPMYSALLLAGYAAARVSADAWAWALLAALALVLAVKAGVEERGMIHSHPGYAAYRQRTRRFVPWLY